MSPQSAKMIVLVTAALMFAAIGIKRDTIADPFRFAWAAGVITLGLSVTADIAPEIAGPFALLVLMAVYWRNRGVVGSVLPTGANAGSSSSAAASPLKGVTSVAPRQTTAGGPQ